MVARRSCVTGSSNRSSCMDGTSRIGLPAPDAAATAIMAGSSMTPDEILERVFLVAGATSTRSGTSRPGRSEDHPTLTRVPVAQPTDQWGDDLLRLIGHRDRYGGPVPPQLPG